ncbi:plastocyanin/azurin family copper-binding protein [Acidianus brierleyi]|uniref:Blue (type 1) copper domain-containing protein n=1 Tax=Acidianus brierleyi TaxID=41673 RepID=A0A2U9ID11_9CREN|nr:plastocyanin/azurin family copper-binding protein [Acidianus brierleyi]AWR93889.1 multicopper oxidase domain-containing protein [Acidianus brierleyi]
MKKAYIIVILIIVGFLVAYYFAGSLIYNRNVVNGYAQISINNADNEIHDIPSYARISNNTIVFTSSNINLVVYTMGHIRAENLTGKFPPSYAHHDVFVIFGLINPTLVIPAGASIHVTVINLDDNMLHNFVVTNVPPPYPYNVMMSNMGPGMMGSGTSGRFITMMPLLHYANYSAGYAYEYGYSFTLNQEGTYWYICTYPGHAQMGMYGKIIVEG